jgi:eukaryotic-like serine/threonine-protein kinase
MERPLNTPKPEKIGKYEILDVLGRGGMGVVYRARDARLGRIVAIKQLTADFSGTPDMLRRFYEEAKKQASLHHNNIVIVFDAGDQDGEPYIVMEYVEGEALDRTLREQKRIELERALSIVEQVCLALAYAHRKGVIHRDVKPANVIVQRDGTAKLFDFGIARDETRLDKTCTSTGIMVGTPPYMAPERFRDAPIDGRSDIFSVGVLLYELVTGRRPFDAAEVPAVIDQILNSNPPAPSTLVSDCPTSLDTIVARALAKSPFERYANADDMAMDLHEVAKDITRAHIVDLMARAEKLFGEREFIAAQSVLRQLLTLDSQHIAAKRLLSLTDQNLTQQERERRAKDLTRMVQQAAAEREWARALALCDEALGLTPGSETLVALRKSMVEGKQTQEKVAQLLFESANARKTGELDRARSRASSAYQLDPNNSQVLALCRELEQEIEEKQLREELRAVLASFRERLAAREFEDATLLFDRAKTLSPDNSEVLRAKDDLATALAEERRKGLVRRLEDKAALTTTLDKLRTVNSELAEALTEFPNDPSLIRLRFTLEPRIRHLENEMLVRDVCKRAAELPPEQAVVLVREALVRVPGNEELFNLEATLSGLATRQTRERLLTQRLGQARQAIDDGLYLEAVKILERCKAEGHSSYEVDGLLEIAKSAGKERRSQELLERTYGQAKRLIEEEAFDSATQMLQRAQREVDEPVLRRLLGEASQKQATTAQAATRVLEDAGNLMRIELFAEAVLLLEEQARGVKRLPRVEEELRRAKGLQEAEASFARLIGRCYAQLGSAAGIEDIKKALNTAATTDTPRSQETMKKRLRQRCEEIYAEKASSAIALARKFLHEDDSQGSEEVLRETRPWLELAPSQAQDDLRALEAEVAAAKKVLRFRRGGWR